MNYGQFNKDFTEYIIENPNTPRPWVNFLTNGAYTAIVSQCGGGYSFNKDFKINQILRCFPADQYSDRPGRYIYIRDKSSGAVWSPTYQPIRSEFSSFKARHGMGYTVISSTVSHIESEITYFVPLNDLCEVWLVKLTNKDKKTKNLQLFPYCELNKGNYNRIWFNRKTHTIHAQNTCNVNKSGNNQSNDILFFSSSLLVKGFATQKAGFVGRYNTEQNPETVFKGKFNNTPLTVDEEGIAAFLHEVSIKPKKTKTFVIVLGLSEKASSLKQLLQKYHSIPKVEKELLAVKEYWKEKVENSIQVETPDPEFDAMVNVWLKYQIIVCNKGSGVHCFREACQDAEGVMDIDPQLGREKILTIARYIRADGTTAPGWSSVTGAFQERSFKDHPVWLTHAVSAYIKETGDREILKEKLPFLKDRYIKGWYIDPEFKENPRHEGEATLFEHMWRNLDFCFHDIDESGLPRIGCGDINKAIDGAGIRYKGGSVWIAQALVRSLKILARLADVLGEREKATGLRKWAVLMTEKVEQFWDGEWYQRGITDDGYIFGSHRNKEGKIFLNTQVGAVLAGIAQGERLHKMLKSVEKNLNTPYGYILLYPAFREYDARLGKITTFAKGTRENTSVFIPAHAAMIIVHCLVGNGDKAYDTLKKIIPCYQKDMELYKTEPYVAAHYIVGAEHPYVSGEGFSPWLTPSAGRMFLAATEWLLGIRREFNGLIIDPCIPKHWKKVHIMRPFRGTMYDISIENPHGVEKGIKEIFVNEEKILGNLIVSRNSEKKIMIRVVLGRPSSKKKLKAKIPAVL